MSEPNELTHYDTAELILQRLVENPGWYGDIPNAETLARAQVHATLAVVDELREARKPIEVHAYNIAPGTVRYSDR